VALIPPAIAAGRSLSRPRSPQADRTAAQVARRFVDDMRAFDAKKGAAKTDQIAGRHLRALHEYQSRAESFILSGVGELSERMKDQA
jgi:hypothetical protein